MEYRLAAQERRLNCCRAELSRCAVAQRKLVEYSLTGAVRVFACMLLDCAQRSYHRPGSSEELCSEMDSQLGPDDKPR